MGKKSDEKNVGRRSLKASYASSMVAGHSRQLCPGPGLG